MSTLCVAEDLAKIFIMHFCEGGYIIKMRPMAIGIEVVPTLIWFNAAGTIGTENPRATPRPIATKTTGQISVEKRQLGDTACVSLHGVLSASCQPGLGCGGVVVTAPALGIALVRMRSPTRSTHRPADATDFLTGGDLRCRWHPLAVVGRPHALIEVGALLLLDEPVHGRICVHGASRCCSLWSVSTKARRVASASPLTAAGLDKPQ